MVVWIGSKYHFEDNNDSYRYPVILIPKKIKEAADFKNKYNVKEADIIKYVEKVPTRPLSFSDNSPREPDKPSEYTTIQEFHYKFVKVEDEIFLMGCLLDIIRAVLHFYIYMAIPLTILSIVKYGIESLNLIAIFSVIKTKNN